jgi:hypothetical protein
MSLNMTPKKIMKTQQKIAGLLALFAMTAMPLLANGLANKMASTSATNAAISVGSRLTRILAGKNVQDRREELTKFGAQLSAEEIPQALALSGDFKQLRERVVFQTVLLKHWAELSPTNAIVYIATLPESRTKADILSFAVTTLAAINPEYAASFVVKLPPSLSRREAVSNVASVWAHKDGSKAAAWAESLPAGFQRESVLNYNILYTWASHDPVGAWSYVQKLPSGSDKSRLISSMGVTWAGIDLPGAIKWANSLPEAEKEWAFEGIAQSWADDDPKAAAAFVLQMPPGKTRQQAIDNMACIWGSQNPQEAGAWVAEKLDAASQPEAATQLLRFWMQMDPQGAGKWVGSLSNGILRSTAISTFVDTAMCLIPEDAANLTLTITDENIRQQKLTACMKVWLETDPTSALKWLKTATVPPEFKERWSAQPTASAKNNSKALP